MQATFLTALFISCIGYSWGEGPTIDDMRKINCPNEQPYLCIHYGHCCAGYEFCSAQEGICTSCFPNNVSDKDLLAWCRNVGQWNVSQMKHGSCVKACQMKFNVSELFQAYCSADRPRLCPSGQCCRADQYCSNASCEDCFPGKLSRYHLADRCRQMVNDHFATSKISNCDMACYSMFSPAQLSNIEEKDFWMIAFFFLISVIAVSVCIILSCRKYGKNIKQIKKKIFEKPTEDRNVHFDRVRTEEDNKLLNSVILREEGRNLEV